MIFRCVEGDVKKMCFWSVTHLRCWAPAVSPKKEGKKEERRSQLRWCFMCRFVAENRLGGEKLKMEQPQAPTNGDPLSKSA